MLRKRKNREKVGGERGRRSFLIIILCMNGSLLELASVTITDTVYKSHDAEKRKQKKRRIHYHHTSHNEAQLPMNWSESRRRKKNTLTGTKPLEDSEINCREMRNMKRIRSMMNAYKVSLWSSSMLPHCLRDKTMENSRKTPVFSLNKQQNTRCDEWRICSAFFSPHHPSLYP